MDRRFVDLVDDLKRGGIDRRTFIVRAVALGASAFAIGAGLRSAGLVAAQDASELSPATIGVPGVEHVTGTDKGTINLYSSWPMTGASEQIGGDSVESVRYALEIWGNDAGGFGLNYQALDDGIAANNGWLGCGERDRERQRWSSMTRTPWSTSRPTTPARPRWRFRSLNEAGMAMISHANTYPGLTKAIEGATEEGEPDSFTRQASATTCASCPADDMQGAAAGALGLRRCLARARRTCFTTTSLYGQGVAVVFSNTFEELGGEVLGFEGYDPRRPIMRR